MIVHDAMEMMEKEDESRRYFGTRPRSWCSRVELKSGVAHIPPSFPGRSITALHYNYLAEICHIDSCPTCLYQEAYRTLDVYNAVARDSSTRLPSSDVCWWLCQDSRTLIDVVPDSMTSGIRDLVVES